jgi:hypothetical protein
MRLVVSPFNRRQTSNPRRKPRPRAGVSWSNTAGAVQFAPAGKACAVPVTVSSRTAGPDQTTVPGQAADEPHAAASITPGCHAPVHLDPHQFAGRAHLSGELAECVASKEFVEVLVDRLEIRPTDQDSVRCGHAAGAKRD